MQFHLTMQNRRSVVFMVAVAILFMAVGASQEALLAQSGRGTKDPKAPVGGWTEFAAKGAKVIHVASDGNDRNPGTRSQPLATLEAAYGALRDGKADSLLLRRGDRWNVAKTFIWTKSGPADEGAGWMRLGAYGEDDEPRPILDFVGGATMHVSPGYRSDRVLSNLAFTDVHFVASDRLGNPRSAASGYGIMLIAVEWRGSGKAFRHVLFENVKLQGFGGGISTERDIEDLRIRRSIFVDLFNPGGAGAHCSGLLTEAAGLLLEDNVFFRIQHPDTDGVDGISVFAHSAYIGAGARDVVCRGNFIIKATEGLMVRSGGVYERNVSAENSVACMFGQAYGVTPTADGVTVQVRENLFLDNQQGFSLGNARGGVFTQNLLLRGPGGGQDQDLTLIGRNPQGRGVNIGVHGVSFTENQLSGKIQFTQSERDEQHYSDVSLSRNRDGVAPLTKDVGDFLKSVGLAGATMSDYAALLVERDRANFAANLQTTPMLNFYRKAVGMPVLKP